MSGTEVTKFDPASYVDKVRDKIKQSLIDVIPDDQWNAMLRSDGAQILAKWLESATAQVISGIQFQKS